MQIYVRARDMGGTHTTLSRVVAVQNFDGFSSLAKYEKRTQLVDMRRLRYHANSPTSVSFFDSLNFDYLDALKSVVWMI